MTTVLFLGCAHYCKTEGQKCFRGQKKTTLIKAEVASNLKSKHNAHVAVLNDCATASYDFQQVLPCPHLQTGSVNTKSM